MITLGTKEQSAFFSAAVGFFGSFVCFVLICQCISQVLKVLDEAEFCKYDHCARDHHFGEPLFFFFIEELLIISQAGL